MADVSPELPHLDVAGYVLGTLEPGEVAAFEAHLAGCGRCRADLDDLGPLAVLLADADPVSPLLSADSPGPAADLEDRVFAAIATAARADGAGPPADDRTADDRTAGAATDGDGTAGGPAVGGDAGVAPVVPIGRGADARRGRDAQARRRSGWLTGRRLGPLVAAAAVVLGVTGGALVAGRDHRPAPDAELQLAAADGGPARAVAVVRRTPAGLDIEMTATGLSPNPEGTMYTCWLVGQGDTLERPNRVSVGSFVVAPGTGPVTVQWTTAADLGRFPTIGVTLEPTNGNPSHQGPKVLAVT